MLRFIFNFISGFKEFWKLIIFKRKLFSLGFLIIFFSLALINFTNLLAEEEEIYLKSISDQIQVLTKDLKTLEKAVYQKSNLD